jgi:hypothetical protein
MALVASRIEPTDRLLGKVIKHHGPAEMPLWITGVTVESVDGLPMFVNVNINQANGRPEH